MRDIPDGVHGGLARSHGKIEEKLIVGGEEGEDPEALGCILHRIGKIRSKLPREQRGRRYIALVHFIPHGKGAGDDELEGDGAGLCQRLFHGGAQRILEPTQPVDDLLRICAEAHHLPDTFIKGTVSKVAECLVADDPQRHGTGDHAGHGADTVHAVVGDKADLAGGCHFGGLLQGIGHTLIYGGAHNGTLHRAAHLLPCDGGTGVTDGVFIQLRKQLAGGADIDELRLAAEDAPQRFPIGLFYLFHFISPFSF